MQSAMRPYVTAGVALVGASVIAVTPIAAHPNLSPMHMPQVQLTASIDNPINVFKPVVEDAGAWLNETVHTVLANPLPILRQIIDNQLYTARQVLDAAKSAGSALGQLAAGLPATLKAVGAQLATGDVNGAIDALITAGLQPILNLLSGPWQALEPALERPFKVAQALIPALYDAGLSMLVGVVISTVGIGFDTGTTPFLKQIVTSTQAVLNSLKTLNPVKIINAVQHGIADVLQNAVTQAKSFTEGTFPYIGAAIIKALRAGLPTTTATAAAAAALPTASSATTVTLAVDATGAAPAATTEKETAATGTGTESTSATAAGETATAPVEAATTEKDENPAAADVKVAPAGTATEATESTTTVKPAETASAPVTKDATDSGSAESGTTATKDGDASSSTATKDAATNDAATNDAATKGVKGGKGTRGGNKSEPGTKSSAGATDAGHSAAGSESAKAGAGTGSQSSGESGSSGSGE